mmetsp:Transcript_34290/g.118161  ORF Transcript_34290/g.118161 Transcript_34290/m.118161 type:complete len:240 (+) Transcript_34290:169-888(+)
MRDDDDGRGLEAVGLAERALDGVVRGAVHGRSRLVDADDAPPQQQRARRAEQLPLAEREVAAVLLDLAVQRALAAVKGVERGERCEDVRVGVLAKGVEVEAQRAAEQVRRLRDDGHCFPQLRERHGARVSAVEDDGAAGDQVEARKRRDERRLARAAAADDAHLCSRRDGKRDAVEDIREALGVLDTQVAELERARPRPAVVRLGAGLRGVLDARRKVLCGQLRSVIKESLDAGHERFC